jgi:hypothetical protein
MQAGKMKISMNPFLARQFNLKTFTFPKSGKRALVVLLCSIGLSTPAWAQRLPAGPTDVRASYYASSSPNFFYTKGGDTVLGLANASSTVVFNGGDYESFSYGVHASYINALTSSPTLNLGGSVTGAVYDGQFLMADAHATATMYFKADCSPKPACLGRVADVLIKGYVQTNVSVSLAAGQAAPVFPSYGYALAEIGVDAPLSAVNPSLGVDNYLAPNYNVFLSQAYRVEGFSPSPGVDTGIQIVADTAAYDPSLNQMGLAIGTQTLGGSLSADPGRQSFLVHALASMGSLYSVSMHGLLSVWSTRRGDSVSLGLIVDPVITIDPDFALANPDISFSIELADGVGNVDAVPEVSTTLLMLAGLGVLGTLARRRAST